MPIVRAGPLEDDAGLVVCLRKRDGQWIVKPRPAPPVGGRDRLQRQTLPTRLPWAA